LKSVPDAKRFINVVPGAPEFMKNCGISYPNETLPPSGGAVPELQQSSFRMNTDKMAMRKSSTGVPGIP
jgi:hypothetical protein